MLLIICLIVIGFIIALFTTSAKYPVYIKETRTCPTCFREMTFASPEMEKRNELKSGNNICTRCWTRVYNKNPEIAANLKDYTFMEIKEFLAPKAQIIVKPEVLWLNLNAKIEYMDDSGQITNREVRMKSIEKGRKDYSISAYCKTKKADRTFKLSRITSMVDMDTAEEITNIQSYILSKTTKGS